MSTQVQEKKSSESVESTHSRPVFAPAVDIYEKDRSLFLVADMPGIDEKSVSVDFEKGVLTIRGHAAEARPEGYRLIYREYAGGDFERKFSVPEDINVEKIEAAVKNGVLTLRLPYSPEPEPRKIQVKIG